MLRSVPRAPKPGTVTCACLSCKEEWVLRRWPLCSLTHKTGSRLSEAAVFQAPCSRPSQQCCSLSRCRKPQAEATQLVSSRAGLRADGPMCPAYPILSLSQPCWGPTLCGALYLVTVCRGGREALSPRGASAARGTRLCQPRMAGPESQPLKPCSCLLALLSQTLE